jgi:hypothetical protein
MSESSEDCEKLQASNPAKAGSREIPNSKHQKRRMRVVPRAFPAIFRANPPFQIRNFPDKTPVSIKIFALSD